MIIEYAQIRSDGWKYFTRYYNQFDIFIIVGQCFYLLQPYKQGKTELDPNSASRLFFDKDQVDHDYDWDANPFIPNQILTIVAFAGIFRGYSTIFRNIKFTRFLTFMVQTTIGEMFPFILFFNGQVLILSAIFTLTDNQDENFLEWEGDNGKEYEHRFRFFKSYLKTIDFTQSKNEYRFKTVTGDIAYVLAIFYLNIIILNVIIALVGDVYDKVMAEKKETELKLKAQMLLELYELFEGCSFFFKPNEEVGQLIAMKLTNDNNNSGDWEGKVKTIVDSVKSIKKITEKKFIDIEKRFNSLDTKLDNITILLQNQQNNQI